MRPFHREVTAWLREYGATDVALTQGAAATESDIRTCLDALRRIEATTPYRLVRRKLDGDNAVPGAWSFVARIE